MAGIGPDDLSDLCADYLDACVVALGATCPDRVFLSPGPPSWDCPDQLCVHAGGPVIADTAAPGGVLMSGHRIQQTNIVNVVSMTATILRCAPTIDDYGNMPTALALTQCAQQTMADVWGIWNFLVARKADGTLFPPKEREFFLDGALVLNPAGAVAGWQIPVRVQLDGFVSP
jgi:hypothetical protein